MTTITVLAATGKTGRRVADRLERLGHDVRRASRSSATRFAWEEPDTWGPAIDGAQALYLVPPDPGGDVAPFVDRLAGSTVARVVLLSARHPEQSGDTFLPDVEDLVRAVAPTSTILRPSWFDQNFDEGFFGPGLAAGLLEVPVGDGREPFIDAEDIAEVAVAALTDPAHAGQTYELSGPEALTFGEAVAAIAEAWGRPIAFADLTPTTFRSQLEAAGVDGAEIDIFQHLFDAIRRGDNDHVSDGVQQALGRPPRSFAAYAAGTSPIPTP